MSEPFEKLAAQLSELFELEKADLDFGIHRIIKARQQHIRIFLGLDEPDDNDPGAPTLKKIVQREMGELNTVELERQLEATAEKIKTNYGQLAFGNGTLAEGPAKDSGDGQLWLTLKEELDSGEDKANAQLEAEIYSHLTEFFSRYYDEADFLSKRRIKAGDAPYAVPYSGEEVMLHWANKDQYYIKSSKDLKDYTFTLPEQFGGKRVQFKCERQDPVLNNNNAKREFHLDLDEDGQPQITTSKDPDGKEALVIGFHFKIVDKTRTQPEAKAWIELLFELLPGDAWRLALGHTPDGAKTNLLTRHLTNYTRKNEADFFIHKHLGQFLRGELDFYIKNEVMHLDDIDEKSSDYLTTRVRLIKAPRTIAQNVIRFLAQLENFQKKLWLKKKYVTETHYCFTLDKIIQTESSRSEKLEVRSEKGLVAAILRDIDTKIRRYDGEMRSQHDEWIKLYAIDELEDYPKDGKLTAEFLRAHDKLMLDTVFYPVGFKWQLIGAMEDLEEQLDGLLIHSENFQALNLLQGRYREKVKCVYIDPPYNTATSAIPYKNNYKHSSFATLMRDRLIEANSILANDGAIFVSIDKTERTLVEHTLDEAFGSANHIEELIWTQATANSQLPNYSTNHEYVEVYAKNRAAVEADTEMFREPKPGFSEVLDLMANLNSSYPSIPELEMALKNLYGIHREAYRQSVEDSGQEWDAEAKRQDPWKGLYPYNRVEYRSPSGSFIEEANAQRERAKIWVWREMPSGAPASKQSPTTKDPDHLNYRYYKPIHPKANEPCPHPQSGWKFPLRPDPSKPDRRSFESLLSDNRIAWGEDNTKIPQTKGFLHEVETNIGTSVFYEYNDGEAELARMFGESGMFLSPKSSKFVKKFILQTTKLDSCFVDFFGGSGSSSHGLIQANREDGGSRRFVTVEMEDYFDRLTKPRVLKAFYALDWRDGKPIGRAGMSGAFKYLRLESYEDALNNLDLGEDRAPDLLGLGDQVREDFLFAYLLDVETRGHLLNLERFRDPWGCQLKIHDPHSGRGEARVIDLVETFHYLLGVTVREIRVQGTRDKPGAFLTIEGESPDGESILIIWRRLEANPDVDAAHRIDWPVTDNEDLKAFAATKRGTARGLNPADTEFHAIYINGDHTLSDPQSKIHCIEEVFYERMFANTGNPED